MTFFNDAKRENNDKKHRSNPNQRGRNVDTNRDGDSQRNRSDDDLFGSEDE